MARGTVAHDRRLRKLKPQTLTAETLRSLLHYDPDTGIFTWRPRHHFRRYGGGWNRKWAGKIAGGRRPDGYYLIGIFNEGFLAHRLAWLYMTGDWPKQLVDHINGDKGDNRFSNLRDVTNGENLFNRRDPSPNRGVRFVRRLRMWNARINYEGREIYLGTFHDKEHALVAYRTAVRLLYGVTAVEIRPEALAMLAPPVRDA